MHMLNVLLVPVCALFLKGALCPGLTGQDKTIAKAFLLARSLSDILVVSWHITGMPCAGARKILGIRGGHECSAFGAGEHSLSCGLCAWGPRPQLDNTLPRRSAPATSNPAILQPAWTLSAGRARACACRIWRGGPELGDQGHEASPDLTRAAPCTLKPAHRRKRWRRRPGRDGKEW